MALSLTDKVIRLSLSTYPDHLDMSQFYPSLSTYRVERVFERAEIEKAVANFLTGNPFFDSCHIAEWEFESVDDFSLASFQEVLEKEYVNYADGFLLASVTYADDPHAQGIFTVFPISLQDGYRCFHFHQTLMRSLKTQQDEFAIAERLRDLGVQVDELEPYLPAKDPAPTSDGTTFIPFETGADTGPVLKVREYFDGVRSRFLERSSENLYTIKNAIAASQVPLGNYLLYLHAPLEVVAQGDGGSIHEYNKNKAAEMMRLIETLEHREQFVELGSSLIPAILSRPHRYIVNNYGDTTPFDGSDVYQERGTLMKYQWYMPSLVLGLLYGPRDGVSWTVTVRENAFNFRSL